MATGLEVAGLILATFPLILSVLEHYENGFQSLKEWSRFRNEFAIFMKSIAKQKLFFRQNIEELLTPIVRSEDQMMWLLNDPGGVGWTDQELDDKLRRRLIGKYEYECYMSTVESILALLEKLKSKLKLVEGELHWTETSAASGRVRIEYEFRRLAYTLGRKKRDHILGKIEKHNNELQSILSNNERLAPMRLKRKSPISKQFHRVRSHASSLHAALSRAWKCDCSLGHAAKLLLERRVNDGGDVGATEGSHDSAVKFRVYFDVDSDAQQYTALKAHTKTEWWATEIVMDCGTDHLRIQKLAPVPSRLGLTLPSPRYSEPLMPYVLSKLNTTSSATAKYSSTKPLLDESRRVSFADLSVTFHSMNSSILSDASEIIDLCTALHQRLLFQQKCGYLRDQCDRLHTITLSADPYLPSGMYRIISLESLLGKGVSGGGKDIQAPALLRRRTRLAIAVTLASSLLQLHPGPWLGEIWGKQDIFFFQSADGTIHTDCPFLLNRFKSSNPPQISTPENDGINTSQVPAAAIPRSRGYNSPLLSLGILILELWFNQTIESLPFRKDYLGVGGRETEYTNYNTAQKWQEQTMDEAGLDLHNPTRRCIYCAFGAVSQNLEDDELRKAVFEEVVQPLERLLQRFEEV